MRDFDAERNAKPIEVFRLGGREWQVRRDVSPEAIFAFDKIDANSSGPESMQMLDDLVVACLMPGQAEAWRELRRYDPDAVDVVGLDTLKELTTWLVETAIGRPTEPPSPSSRGSKTKGTTGSTVESPSLAAVASPE